jgi:hypothetical protein
MAELSVQFLRVETPLIHAFRESSRVATVKIIDPPSENPFPGKQIVGRFRAQVADEGDLIAKGAAGADEWWARFGGEVDARPWIGWWENCNEPYTKGQAAIMPLVAYTHRWLDHAEARGKKGVILNFSQGTPEPEDAHLFASLARRCVERGHLFAFHEYWWPRIGDPGQHTWNYLRFPRFFAALRGAGCTYQPNVLITEYGADRGVVGNLGGWRQAGISASDYLADALQYRQWLGQFAYVKAAYMYCAGHYDGDQWESFDLEEGIVRGALAANPEGGVPLTHAAYVPIVQNPPKEETVALDYDGRCFSPDGYRKYLAGANTPVTHVIVHHTYIPDLPAWRGTASMTAMKKYYESLGWKQGPHAFCAPEGIWVMTPFGHPNRGHLGTADISANKINVEIVGDYRFTLPSGAVLDNAVGCVAALLAYAGKGVEIVSFHRDWAKTECPGSRFYAAREWFKDLVADRLKEWQGLPIVAFWQAAEGYQLAQNPRALFWKMGRERGWEMNSHEFTFEGYVCQVWYDEATHKYVLLRHPLDVGGTDWREDRVLMDWREA